MSRSERWLGIDFSGDATQWGPGVSRTNVWIAEVARTAASLQLVDVSPVQQLPGSGHPFDRLANKLAAGDFKAAGIDAPLSVPGPCVPSRGHRNLLLLADALPTEGRPFPTGAALLEALTPYPGETKKPLRATERNWQERKVNVRSTMWNGSRGGAAFTVAALKLLALAGRPVWPFADATTSGLIVEAFPAAQLKAWDIEAPGYSAEGGGRARQEIVRALADRVELAHYRETLEEHADALDATLAAFAAVAVTEGRLFEAPGPTAPVEGWIAVHDADRDARPGSPPLELLTLREIPPHDASAEEVLRFAHTFDGYEMAGSFEAPAELANRRFQFTVDELRTILFFEHRRWRHFGEEPDAEAIAYIRWLIEAIRQRVRQGAATD
jgi:hypothetical protein